MTNLITYRKFSDLDDSLLEQYRSAITLAFPEVILMSKVTKEYWNRLENYFPHTQIFLISETNELIGFINAIPIFWDQPMNELPNQGWDWLVKKGIEDFETKITPNTLGGLQIVVCEEYQGKGYSKLLILKGKELRENLGFENFIIPIRPILKYKYPDIKMKDYINFREQGKIYDPWIRTHLQNGATLIKVCENSMNVTGTIRFWEELLQQKIKESGPYQIQEALNLVWINIEEEYGEYREENIWIQYI